MVEKVLEFIERDKLNSKSRLRELIHKRVYLYAFLRSNGYKLQEIGKMFNRDHATVIHGINNFKIFKKTKDPLFDIDTMEYKKALEGDAGSIDLKRDIFEDLKSCNQFRDLDVIKKRIENGMY